MSKAGLQLEDISGVRSDGLKVIAADSELSGNPFEWKEPRIALV